jgi:hypothetical protein
MKRLASEAVIIAGAIALVCILVPKRAPDPPGITPGAAPRTQESPSDHGIRDFLPKT